MRWAIRTSFIDRIRLRRGALRYTGHGWAVIPGACLTGARFACGRPGCPTTGSHPALERWVEAATCDPDLITRWWRVNPHTVLLATGHAFDVVEVPARLGRRVCGLNRLAGDGPEPQRPRVCWPVAVTPTGRWMFFVRPGDALCPELNRRADIVRHGRGSWVPAPPSRLVEGPVRWAVDPAEAHWQLPGGYAVQALVVASLDRAASPDGAAPLNRAASPNRAAPLNRAASPDGAASLNRAASPDRSASLDRAAEREAGQRRQLRRRSGHASGRSSQLPK